jgi:RNA polymerase sigma-70 factor (sigma-E family)
MTVQIRVHAPGEAVRVMGELRVVDRGAAIDFAALYAAHWRPLVRVAQGLVDDAASAEDVVQEAFAALYRKQSSLTEPAAAVGYLRSCVLNGARSALRRRRTVRAHLAVATVDEAAPAADHRSLLTDEHDRVRTTLAALPARQREVLTLRFLGQLTDHEIAAVTGMSAVHVRSAASRGLAALRTTIGGQP